MVSDQIRQFCNNFPTVRNNNFQHNETTRLITDVIPTQLMEQLDLDDTEYVVKGSVGQGGWADIPWVAIMHKGITSTTQSGYYIPLLFEKNMTNLYVSLGLGWTQFSERYGNKAGRQKVREYADRLINLLTSTENLIIGSINLGAQTDLGKGYEVANIVSKKLGIDALNDEELTNTISGMLTRYKEIMEQFGADLFYDLDPEAEDELPEVSDLRIQVKRESLNINKGNALLKLKSLSDSLTAERRKLFVSQIIRNGAFANYVKERANYICEICGRTPFMKKNNQPYAEADHVEPLGNKGIDHPDNMRCLCAQCHRVITYGSNEEIDRLLKI